MRRIVFGAFVAVALACTGTQGPQGEAGPQGPTGPQGTPGPQGVPGPTGTIGPIGETGAMGLPGATGPTGPVGPAGATGATGANGLDGLPGPAGPAGATGATGATGPLPTVATNGGLLGTGAVADPLKLDPAFGVSRIESVRILEAEGAVTPSTTIGTINPDTSASGGKVRFGAASGSPGTLWRMESAQVGGLLGTAKTQITLRAKVTNTLAGTVLANFRCGAKRAGTTSFTDVATAVSIVPNQFPGNGQWRELVTVCDFLPDDVDQFVSVESFVAGITDLSLDYARVSPVVTVHPWGYSRVAAGGCQTATNTVAPIPCLPPLNVQSITGTVRIVFLCEGYNQTSQAHNRSYLTVDGAQVSGCMVSMGDANQWHAAHNCQLIRNVGQGVHTYGVNWQTSAGTWLINDDPASPNTCSLFVQDL